MIRLPALLCALFLLISPFPVSAHSPDLAEAWNGAEINWRDIGSGIKESVKTGKAVIMVFHAPWCSACKKYREVFKDPDVVAAAREFVMILIDADADRYANGAFAPDGSYVPRTIFLDSEGNVRSELKGSDPDHLHSIDLSGPAELLALMKKAQGLSRAVAPGVAPDGI